MNIFEELSDGRIIDLVTHLEPNLILEFGDHNKTRCPECGGSGNRGAVIDVDLGTAMSQISLVLCDLCEGSGEATYVCNN